MLFSILKLFWREYEKNLQPISKPVKKRRTTHKTSTRPKQAPVFDSGEVSEDYYQGYFEPSNPEKYRGDVSDIYFRSHWELRAFHYCDNSAKVIAWASEETIVPYYMKGRRKPYKYYPDLMIYFDTKEVVMVEIKPKYEASNPSRQNINKWAAARQYCKQRGWRFQIWTEDTINKLYYR